MLLQCSFYSYTLKSNTNVNIFLPSATVEGSLTPGYAPYENRGERYPVLYLLHGAFDDANAWRDNTNICRYAQERQLAVVMPSAGNSFYQNMAHGAAVSDFIAQELPGMAEKYFPVATERERTFLAGNSMGGYGAFYTALCHPARYAAAASLSGALDIARAFGGEYGGLIPARAEDVFTQPKSLADSSADLFSLCKARCASGERLPALAMCCGTEDFLIEDNRRARDRFAALGVRPAYTEAPGVHGWEYWESHICEILDWLLEQR